MSNALSTVTRGSMKKVSNGPGFPRLQSRLGAICRPWSHISMQIPVHSPWACAWEAPTPQSSLFPTAVGAVMVAFPLSSPSLVVTDSPDNEQSALSLRRSPVIHDSVCGQVFPPDEIEQVSNKDDMKTSLKKVVKEVGAKGQRGEFSSPGGHCRGSPSLKPLKLFWPRVWGRASSVVE